MLLAVDIGNTNITLGAYRDSELMFVSRLATDPSRTGDQYAITLRDIIDLYGYEAASFDAAIISCVVPALTGAFGQAVERLFSVRPLVIGPGIKTGLNIKIDDPGALGADLVAGGVAAVTLYPLPCIVFDMGTATTVSVIDGRGVFLGGLISAGIGISMEALATKTAQLPYISLETPASVIGTNAVDSMRAGIIFSASAVVDGISQRVEAELGQTATVVATGGLAKIVVDHCKREVIYHDNLLLEGLRIIYEKNK